MKFKEVIGHNDIKVRLINSFKSNRLSHAYLFYGIPGVGKKALALAFAQYISCENRTENDSCGFCSSCHKYEKLIHPDLHFVFPVISEKGAKSISDSFLDEWREIILENPYFSYTDWIKKLKSENKQASIFVEESAEIIRKLNFKSFESDYKIMLIWLPEKMNQQCANKILKILEEPPTNTIFLMVSDQREEVLPTIYSRTQPIKILGIEDEELKKYIINNYTLSEAEADDIVKISGGSLIEACEQIQTSEENKFNLQKFISLMRYTYKREINEIINWAESMVKIGREGQKSFLNYSLILLRESFIYNFNNSEIVYLTTEERNFIEKFSKIITKDNVEKIYKIFNEAHYHIERNANAKIVLTDMAFLILKIIK